MFTFPNPRYINYYYNLISQQNKGEENGFEEEIFQNLTHFEIRLGLSIESKDRV